MRLILLFSFWFIISWGLIFSSFFYLAKVNHIKTGNIWANNFPGINNSVLGLADSNNHPKEISPSSDIRIQALHKFFQPYNSPLQSQAEELVRQADSWGIPYTLIPAIAMQESGGCRVIPQDSYNCWGFGVYGAKVTRFNSYQEAVSTIAKKIKETYIKNGLVNPTLLEDVWAPQSNGIWSYAVNYFTSKIQEIEQNLTST